MGLKKEQQLELYTTMQTIRMFEDRIVDLYAKGQVPGLAHLYIGEEAVAAGVCAALREDDYITSTHRGHGHCLAKGGDPNAMMAELLGKATGVCLGQGGSMHMASVEKNFWGGHAIVGAHLPMANGAAWSAQLRESGQVAVAFFGDKYGDIVVDTNKSFEVYKKWLAMTRPAPGPDGLRRPLWLKRALRPAEETFYL